MFYCRRVRPQWPLIVHDSVMVHTQLHPTLGIRQGCPLSLYRFALLISPIASYLQKVWPVVSVLLYADDVLIIVNPNPPQATLIIIQCAALLLRQFSAFCVLRTNSKQSLLLLGD